MTSVLMERTGVGVGGLGTSGVGTTSVPGVGAPTQTSWMMVPRCTYKFEKCQGGMKVNCVCDDTVSRSMMQNLCTMLTGGMFSCCCMLNGMTVCNYNFTMGLCKCEMTDKGICFTCTSGDKGCCEMIQSCCDGLSTMLKCGCTCCVLVNNTPVCCGCC